MPGMNKTTEVCTCTRDWLDMGLEADFEKPGCNWYRRMGREMRECCGAMFPIPLPHPHVTRFGDGTVPK